jgi:hypothetical protein
LRNRRAHSFDYIKTKLASLDFILGHSEFDYFEGEADKVQYFEDRFQIRPQDIPGKTYRGANRVPDTIRYFVDKFPMFLDGLRQGEPLPTLTYIDPGIGHLTDFKTHLEAYAGFLKRLPRFGFIYAGPSTIFCAKADKLFKETVETRTGKLSSQPARYFTLRSAWDAKRYGTLNNADLEFLKHARQCFVGEPFESTYKKWQSGKVSYNISESGHDANVSFFTGKSLSNRANVTTSKSYNTHSDFRFDTKTFTELRNAQSVTIAYDGLNPLPPMFCYLKPYYNDVNRSYFDQLARGEL